MAAINLGEFIVANRAELVIRCKARAATMAAWPSTEAEIDRGIPLFLNQLVDELDHASQTRGIRRTAVQHGQDLFSRGFTVAEVVHDYGNVCQAVTDLAVELAIPVSTDDFRTLNRCLDDAIAGAVTEYGRQQQLKSNGLSQELRTLINTAITAFEALQTGSAGIEGTTGDLVHRSLIDIRGQLEATLSSVPGTTT
jgi:hypothetical protein